MKNIITEPGETRHFILELLAEACQKAWASSTDYVTLDKNLGEYLKFNNFWFTPTVFATLGGCFILSGGLLGALVMSHKNPGVLAIGLMTSVALASVIAIVSIFQQWKKLRLQVNWEQLDFFLEVRKLLDTVYDISTFYTIDSGEVLRKYIETDVRATVNIIQKNKIENHHAPERIILRNLVDLIVRLGWMNTEKIPVFHDGSGGEEVIWRARADWLYGELFKQV